MRHNRNISQQPLRGSERSTSGASNLTFNYNNSSSGAMQEKSTDSTNLTSSSNAASSRNKMVSVLHVIFESKLNYGKFINTGTESTKITNFQSTTSIVDNFS
jgi:hypothetical protein